MRFLIDEDLSPEIASQLRVLGVDAVSIFDLGREGLDDAEQLAFAAAQDRCFVTLSHSDVWRSNVVSHTAAY